MTIPATELGIAYEDYLAWEAAWKEARDGSPFCPEPQIYFDVPFEIYVAWEAESQSSLKPLARSPGHYKHAQDYPKELDSKPVDLGNAVDAALLESPELAAKQFCTPPFPLPLKADGKPYSNYLVSKPGKQWLADMERAGITILSIADVFKVFGMLLAIHEEPDAMEIIRRSRMQVSMVWTDPMTGLNCKGRFDLLDMDGPPPWRPADIKTTGVKVDPHSPRDEFKAQAGKLNYDRQAGFYCWGLDELTGEHHGEFPIIAVEQTPPHPVAVYRVPPEDIDKKKDEIGGLLELLAVCRATGKWPKILPPPDGKKYHDLIIPHYARS